jgi:hypothetical protein
MAKSGGESGESNSINGNMARHQQKKNFLRQRKTAAAENISATPKTAWLSWRKQRRWQARETAAITAKAASLAGGAMAASRHLKRHDGVWRHASASAGAIGALHGVI